MSLVWSLSINGWKGNDIDLNRNIKLEYSDVLNEMENKKTSHALNSFKYKTQEMEISLSEPSTSWMFRLKINEREPLLIECLPVMLVFPPLLLLSLFFPASLLLCPWGGCLSRVLDEDFYKQPFSELIGYVYVAPTNILPLCLLLFSPLSSIRNHSVFDIVLHALLPCFDPS